MVSGVAEIEGSKVITHKRLNQQTQKNTIILLAYTINNLYE